MKVTKDKILEALGHVMDPDLKKDLVSLNMISDIEINGNDVRFSVVLTTPACPLKESIKKACIDSVKKYAGEDLNVVVTMLSNVTTQPKKKENLLSGVKNIIAVASGKGGVGKSTVSVNLAISLSKSGAKVGLIDADIYGPSIPLMFDLVNAQPKTIQVGEKMHFLPIEKYGIHLVSIGFFVDPSKAMIWRGPMASSAITQFISDAEWGELDYLIIDLPPGTGDIHLTLVQTIPVTGVVIVSTPQNVALADARKAVNMFSQESINVPILGLVENMSWFTPKEYPENKYYIFGKEGCKKLADEMNVPLLGQIPLVQSICESGDSGIPVALDKDSVVGSAFLSLAELVSQQIAIRNANIEPTKILEITNK